MWLVMRVWCTDQRWWVIQSKEDEGQQCRGDGGLRCRWDMDVKFRGENYLKYRKDWYIITRKLLIQIFGKRIVRNLGKTGLRSTGNSSEVSDVGLCQGRWESLELKEEILGLAASVNCKVSGSPCSEVILTWCEKESKELSSWHP